MVTEARKKYRQELRRAILDAAREAFAAHGFEGVSMRMLAERIGCSHGSLYTHFRGKDEIFDALVDESFQSLAESLRAITATSASTDVIRLVRKAARAYVDFGVANPSAYEFAFILRRPGPPRPPHAAYGYLRALIKRCIDEKRFRRMRIDLAAQALWAAVHGITALLILRPSFPWAGREAVVRRVIDSAVDGLLAPKPTPPDQRGKR